MDPEAENPEIPYYTPERIEDPPGGISYNTPAVGCIEKIFFSISYLPMFQKCAIGFG